MTVKFLRISYTLPSIKILKDGKEKYYPCSITVQRYVQQYFTVGQEFEAEFVEVKKITYLRLGK